MNFKDKIALVTGGTSGIGKETAKQLLLKGATVIINYGHNEELADKVKHEFIEFDKHAMYIKADISNEKEVKYMFDEIEKKYEKLDYLINNAGTNIDSFIEHFKVEDFRKVIDVNLIGKFICTKLAVPLLKKTNNAVIINIASRLGTRVVEESSAYCSAEAAIIIFTEASALELSKYHIRVNTVSPGLTMTPMSISSWSEEEIKITKEKNPMKRLGETIDIANTVLFLLSDNANYINGENINVNGGTLLN